MRHARGCGIRAALVGLSALLLAAAGVRAQATLAPVPMADGTPRTALRVCQDPNNLPFSSTQADGIENKVAQILGQALGLPVTYYSFPQRMAFIRNTLRYKLPGEDFRCDIVMGVPAGFDQVAASKPYYHSTYALVLRKGRGFDDVKSGADFLQRGPEALRKLRIGVYDRSPASDWLARHGLEDAGVPYAMLSADPAQYPGEIVERDLASGKIDAAIVWGPIAGYYAKRLAGTTPMLVVPLKSEPGVKFEFGMALGVRHGERDWLQQVQQVLDMRRAEIRQVLDDFGVPLVEAPLTAASR